jgi:hypothetical protein
VCAGPSLTGWERPGAPGLNSLERQNPTMPNASNCRKPPGRRDAPGCSQHPEASERRLFFQKQPGIRFKNSPVSVSKPAWYPVRYGASDTTVGVGGLRLRTSPQRGGGAPPIAPVERDCRRLTVLRAVRTSPCVRDLRTSRTLRRPALHASASVHALPALLRNAEGRPVGAPQSHLVAGRAPWWHQVAGRDAPRRHHFSSRQPARAYGRRRARSAALRAPLGARDARPGAARVRRLGADAEQRRAESPGNRGVSHPL